MHRRPRRSALTIPIGFTALAALAFPPPPSAVGQRLPEGEQVRPASGPLARFGTSTRLACHMARRDSPSEGVFFGETACATVIAVDGQVYAPDDIPGGGQLSDVAAGFEPRGQSTRPGPGGEPLIVTTAAAGDIDVHQVDRQVPGSARVETLITVTNRATGPHAVTVFRAGDCYSDGRDEGFGRIRPGVTAACVSGDDGSVVRVAGAGARGVWQGAYQDLWLRLSQFAGPDWGTAPGFDDTCRCGDSVDNAVAVQWAFTLRPGESRTLSGWTDVGATVAPGRIGSDPEPAPGGRPYVAMGDSYSSGEGAGKRGQSGGFSYLPGTDTGTNRCHRSVAAYAPVVTAAMGADPSQALDFRACSGAVIADVRGPNARNGEAPQVDGLGSETVFASLTIGGNDVGFAPILTACYTNPIGRASCDRSQAARAATGIRRLREAGPGSLRGVYRDITQRLTPQARVVVVGYPDFVPNTGGCLSSAALGADEKYWISQRIHEVDALIAQRAAWSGVDYVDVNGPYFGKRSPHRVCGPQEFVNGVIGIDATESFHPNRDGQQAMATEVLTTFRTPKSQMGRVRSKQLVTPETPASVVLPPNGSASLQMDGIKSSISVLSLRHGDAAIDVSVRDSRGVEIPLESIPDDGSDDAPMGGSIVALGGTTAVQLRGVPEGTYEVVLSNREAEPVLVTARATSLEDSNHSPFALAWISVGRDRLVRFNGSPSSDMDELHTRPALTWDFGDGTTATGRNVVHRYARHGRYTVSVRARDLQGAEDIWTGTVITHPERYITMTATRAGRGVRVRLHCTPLAVRTCATELTARFRTSRGVVTVRRRRWLFKRTRVAMTLSPPRGAARPTSADVRLLADDEGGRPGEGILRQRVTVRMR